MMQACCTYHIARDPLGCVNEACPREFTDS